MPDFLLELRCEEVPARMQAGARADLEKLFRKEMDAAGVALGAITIWSTPRRLALIARDLPEATEAVSEEVKGPKVGAPPQALEGFLRKTGLTQDQLTERDGVWFAVSEKPGRATRDVLAEAIPAIVRAFPWPKSMRWGEASLSTESLRWVRPLSGIVAILGEDLVECEVGGVASGYATLGHRFHHPGEITIGGASDYQEKLRACHVIVDHQERQDLIREKAKAAAEAAGLTLVEDEGLVVENAGLTEWPVPLLGRFDEEYLEVPPEVIQLTARTNQKYFVCEFPSRLREGLGEGMSSPAAKTSPLPAPPASGRGELANAFVCTANIEASDGGEAIVAGNRKVLAARLSDARFFWDQDRKVPLEEQAKKLERITFHEKLGTVADKVERVAKLARWLVEEGIVVRARPSSATNPSVTPAKAGAQSQENKAPQSGTSSSSGLGPGLRRGDEDVVELANLAEQAARLAKADLVTEMVGEFPELQGLMGGYYARAEGLPDAVADTIRDHYKPVGQGDEVPTAPVTVAVSLADKLDTLFAFFSWDLLPTGSKDPFALRRAALAIVAIVLANNLRLDLAKAGRFGAWKFRYNRIFNDHEFGQKFLNQYFSVEELEDENFGTWFERSEEGAWAFARDDGEWVGYFTFEFLTDRLKVQQREAGVRHDLIDAVFALGGEDDLVRLLARVHALQSFVATQDGANLLAGYKRAANILKKEGWPPTPENSTSVTPAKAGAQPQENEASRSDTSLPGLGSGLPRNDVIGSGPHDGEEDPFAMVDDPDVAAALRARAAVQKKLSYTPEPAEQSLIDALDSAEPQAATSVEAEDFAGAMAALASLRAPIDRFFDEVTVNDPDPAKRKARLDLLARFRAAVHQVADFGRIEG